MIIVTGGAGFIGSAIVAGLNARGIENILIVDILGKDEKWKNLRRLSYADYMEVEDFWDILEAEHLEWPVEAIFHMGACSDTTEIDCSYLATNNYDFSKELAEWAMDIDARFIYASSAATYGDGTQGFSDDEDRIDTLVPLNMYGYSKQMFDLWARRTGLLRRIVGLKYFNVFGPNEYHKGNMRSFVVKAFEQISATGGVRLFKSHHSGYTDGQQLRDFIYIKDAVDMTLFFFDNPELAGLYNVGAGQAKSWNDLANAIFTAMGRQPKIEYVDMPDEIRDKYQYFTQADISKLRKTGYRKPTTPLEAAVTEYIQKYLQKSEYLGIP
ncbi:MAG: ADP-glyceromanno-heptose 6-epimerase [Phycisphaerae bacterium]|nr:ADP-glyceromanno-heptose 6-epimerase [Phycisphaerae bacterium]